VFVFANHFHHGLFLASKPGADSLEGALREVFLAMSSNISLLCYRLKETNALPKRRDKL